MPTSDLAGTEPHAASSRLGLHRHLHELSAGLDHLAVEQQRLARLVDAMIAVGDSSDTASTRRAVLRLAVELTQAGYGLFGGPRTGMGDPASDHPDLALYESRDGEIATPSRVAPARLGALTAVLADAPAAGHLGDTALIVGVRSAGRTLGGLYLREPTAADRFTGGDLFVTRAFAATAAVALHRALLGESAGHPGPAG